MFSPVTLERGFDRISPFYDTLARLFPWGGIERSQLVYLDRFRGAKSVLIVGGGNGGFLRALLESGFDGHVVYLDISGKMIRRAHARVADLPAARIDFRQGDVGDMGTLIESERFDLICTHYVLDVFTPDELDTVMSRLDRALEPSGAWLCTDFSPPGGGLLRRLFQRTLLRGLYAFFGRVCGVRPRQLPPIDASFSRRGYVTTDRQDLSRGILWTALNRKSQAIRSRVTVESDGQPQSAMATSNSWRSSSRTRATPA